jgi:streptogramin lyase
MQGIRKLTCLFAAMIAALAAVAGPAAAAGAGTAPIAPASDRGVTEFPVQAKRISGLAQSPDGTITYIGGVASWQHPESRYGWVGPNGSLGETAAPMPLSQGISIDAEGTAWLPVRDANSQSWLGRLSSTGTWSIVPGTWGVEWTTPAAGGGVWFIQSEPDPISNRRGDKRLEIGRVSEAGGVTATFPIIGTEPELTSIVEGHEGNAWFTRLFSGKIGRITPGGQLTEFPLPAGVRPSSLVVDGEGNFWYSAWEVGRIGRITPTGAITEFTLPTGVRPGKVTVGGDGRIWFTEGTEIGSGEGSVGLGRITPAGRYTQIELPDRASEPQDLITGSEGDVWYTAMGEHGCEGGGGSCIVWEPTNPAIVGRVAPTPLKTVVTAGQATVGRRGVKAPVACEGGDASDHCQGRITIKGNGRMIATVKFSLEADQARGLVVPFARGVKSPLGGRKSMAATVTVVAGAGEGSRRKVSLQRSEPVKG